MPTYTAFLRALNVGGRFAKMADLRTGLIHKGFGEVESYIQSGNLRFPSGPRSVPQTELAFETALEELCGFTVSAIIRTPVLGIRLSKVPSGNGGNGSAASCRWR
jgi:uncharacterized protein (DUF1697 family)